MAMNEWKKNMSVCRGHELANALFTNQSNVLWGLKCPRDSYIKDYYLAKTALYGFSKTNRRFGLYFSRRRCLRTTISQMITAGPSLT